MLCRELAIWLFILASEMGLKEATEELTAPQST